MELKRIIAAFVILLSTFSLGYFFAIQVRDEARSDRIQESPENSSLEKPDSESTQLNKIVEVSEPEFRDLPEVEYPLPTNNLVDIAQTNATYRESEVVAKDKEAWLVFYDGSDGYRLKRVGSAIRKKKTISYPGDEYDVHLTFDVPGEPIFALKGIRGVEEGPIRTLFVGPSSKEIGRRSLRAETMGEGYERTFDLNGVSYTLRTSRGQKINGDNVTVLVLETNQTSQVVTENYSDDIGNLLWAGDIDKDGKLDLYFDESNEKGAYSVGLYLSTHAEAGKLVKLTASFAMAGC